MTGESLTVLCVKGVHVLNHRLVDIDIERKRTRDREGALLPLE